MVKSMISILIPTMNRPHFLRRALSYYAHVHFNGYVCIGDSSSGDQRQQVEQIIHAFQARLNIIHAHFPNPPYLHAGMVVQKVLEQAPTPYAVTGCDDDFVFLDGIKQCIDFLETNPEYSAAHGVRFKALLQPEGIYGRWKAAYIVAGHNLESASAYERWTGYIRQATSTSVYVHRTETWRRMYRDVGRIKSSYLGAEVLPCSLSAITGKIKQLDCITYIMQIYEQQYHSARKYFTPSALDEDSQQTLIQSLAEAIAAQENQALGVEATHEIYSQVERDIREHVAFCLQPRAAKLNDLLTGSHNWLRELLDPTNPYYPDIRRVYLAFAIPPLDYKYGIQKADRSTPTEAKTRSTYCRRLMKSS